MNRYMRNTGPCDWAETKDRIVCRTCGAQSSLDYAPRCREDDRKLRAMFASTGEGARKLGTWLLVAVLAWTAFAAIGWFIVGPIWRAL